MARHGKRVKRKRPPRPEVRAEKKAARPDAAGVLPAGAHGAALVILFLIGFGLYAQTISYEHALDDKLYITHNQFTKKGLGGIGDILGTDLLEGMGLSKQLVAGGRYRPFTLSTYAVEWELFGLKNIPEGTEQYDTRLRNMAHFSHAVNAVIYGLCGVMIYLILFRFFPTRTDRKWYLSLPFVVTALYLAHPVHTEVVANIKGRDDLVSLLGSLVALWCTVRWLDTRKTWLMVVGAVAFLVGFFSKEATATMLPVIPLAVWFFTKHSLKDIVSASIPLGVALAVGIAIRYAALGGALADPVTELMNDPFVYVERSDGSRLATTFFVMAMYFKLLVVPHPLTHDYYPWHPIAPDGWKWGQAFPYPAWSDPIAILGLVLFLGIMVFAVWGTRRKHPAAFGVWVFFFPFILFSNVLFAIGVFMNERFLFIPSLGFCFVLGWWLCEELPKKIKHVRLYDNVLTLVLVAIIGLYSVITIKRNPAWRNDRTLATTDLEISSNSAKNNMSAGEALLDLAKVATDPTEKAKLVDGAIKHLNRSLELYPAYYQPMDLLGNAYFLKDDYERSVAWFDKCLGLKPGYEIAIQNLETIGNNAFNLGRPHAAVSAYETLLKYTDDISHTRLRARVAGALGQVYGRDLNDLGNALRYLEQSVELDPGDAGNLQRLGVAYAMTGQPQKAIDTLKRALDRDPGNAGLMMNIGYAYRELGDEASAQQYLDRAFQLDPSLRQ